MSLHPVPDFVAPDEATRRQIEAAHPQRSTWLAANAGSGKTRVLTDRVARLLLNGTPPQNILCLTYTKAAAGEMQNRLFARLGEWAMKDDAALGDELRKIGVISAIDTEALGRARTLFAKAIETPGGLKIQTIHSFCASVLRQFPLEAAVSPAFREIDDRESRLLRTDVFDRLAEGEDAAILADFARYCSSENLDDVLSELVANAEAFLVPIPEEEIIVWFGLSPEDTRESLFAPAFDGGVIGGMLQIADTLRGGTDSQKKTSAAFDDLAKRASYGEDELAALSKLLVTDKGEPRSLLFKALAKYDETAVDTAHQLIEHIATVENRLISFEESRRTLVLHRFARRFVAAHKARKDLAGVLDFDDLIDRTLKLLSSSAMAEWVLFKLDGGIDHILVDEAQDTSPKQWAIIEKLAQEFASGAGARGETLRTIFAVGDRKQSIYSFQGADPAEFDRMRDHFRAQLALSERELAELSLLHSFRSSPAVLGLVDQVFASGISHGTEEETRHIAFKSQLPGRLDLWPLIEKNKAEDLPEWHDASERMVPKGAALQLADRLADEIKRMIAEEQIPDDKGGLRPVTAGDFLVLVRRRSMITEPLILALKRRGVDVAGADQIDLASDLAVMDVIALLKVLVTPADDLSLAAALRSPIFGFSERDLYHLAHHRAPHATLLEALEAAKESYPEAVALIDDMRAQADYLRPFDLIERLLVRHRVRQKLAARLGTEIEEALDVLLQQSIAYESSDVPSLTGFLTWQEVEAVKIKRQSEGAGEKLRVMTVHGAKGLEANIVILPDTADYAPPMRQSLLKLPDGNAVFRSGKGNRPASLLPIYLEEERRLTEESNRLLYVALTRPRQWLITCGAGTDREKEDKQPSWHRLIAEAMEKMGAFEVELAGQPGRRVQFGDWPQSAAAPAAPASAEAAPPDTVLPPWADSPAEAGPAVPQMLSPSRIGSGAHALAGESEADREEAMLRGTQLHLLLEHLPMYPATDWPSRAAGLLRQGEIPPLDEEIAERLAEAVAVLTSDDLGWIFAPETEALTEVDITSSLPETSKRLLGRIDRLIRREDGSVLAVDFKSNAVVPEHPSDVPEGILTQLGAYIYGLEQIFPGVPASAAVLWTKTGSLMELPRDLALAALRKVTL